MRTTCAIITATLFTFAGAAADELWPDASSLAAASFPGAATREIPLGHGVVAPARFELTEKGNGGLTLPGVGIRVYDAHRDGVTYRDYLLTCTWQDVNADGFLDLTVSGTAQYWSEKDGRLELEKPISAQFIYSPAKRGFTVDRSSPEIFTWANRQTAPERPTSPEK